MKFMLKYGFPVLKMHGMALTVAILAQGVMDIGGETVCYVYI